MRFLPAVALLLMFAVVLPAQEPSPKPIKGEMQVWFSPNGGCAEAVVDALSKAKESVYVQAYSFTSVPIAKALVEAHKRGVKVEVVLDKSQKTEKYSSADFLTHEGIPTYIDAVHKIAHNKVMVVDGQTVITGSFNFTKAAEEKNAENVLVIRGNKELAKLYLQNWQWRWDATEAYKRKG